MNKPTRFRLGSSAVGQNLAEYLARLGYLLHADCGGRGTCGKCRVRLVEGYLFENADCTRIATPDANGYVPACHTWCCNSAIIELPEQKGSGLTAFEAHMQPAQSKAAGYGIALDVGTTTLAAALVAPDSGEVLATTSALNPQASFGADVISRIDAVMQRPESLAQMQSALLDAVRAMMHGLLGENTAVHMTVAGNPTMLHLFCGICPVSMGTYPFTPTFTAPKVLSGADLGLPAHKVTCLPSISAFVGGDVTAGMLHCGLTDSPAPVLLVDIGTNGESVLFTGTNLGGQLFAASAAAGPAMEGAGISSGMGGVSGAVSSVRLQNGTPICSTVGNAPARGICGSGLIDLMAALYQTELMDATGALAFGDSFVYATTASGDPLSITQADVRAFQLSKSAIRASIEALCARASLSPNDLACVYLAGGLGYYMNVDAAIVTGLLPQGVQNRTQSVGNAALGGCVRALIDPDQISVLHGQALRTQTLDLTADSVWNQAFMEHMLFPEE